MGTPIVWIKGELLRPLMLPLIQQVLRDHYYDCSIRIIEQVLPGDNTSLYGLAEAHLVSEDVTREWV